MTREEAIEILDRFAHHSHSEVVEYPRKVAIEAFDMAIEALKAEPCENAVSRAAVLNTLDAMDKALDEDRTIEHYKGLLKECYKELPPVTPKQRTGKWIPTQHFDEWYCPTGECSNCGIEHIYGLPFCPSCGAKMEVVSE